MVYNKIMKEYKRSIINQLCLKCKHLNRDTFFCQHKKGPCITNVEKCGNVYNHTMLTTLYVVEENNPLFSWAALLHDVGKPSTTKFEDGRWKSKGHVRDGAIIAKNLLKRLKFSNDDIEFIFNLVNDHMRIKDVKEMKKSSIRKLLGLSYIDDLIKISYADSMSSSGDIDWFHYIEEIRKTFIIEKKEIFPPCLINGNDLISLGLKPGPIFKELLGKVLDLQLEDELKTKDEALEFIRGEIK